MTEMILVWRTINGYLPLLQSQKLLFLESSRTRLVNIIYKVCLSAYQNKFVIISNAEQLY